MKLFYKYIKGNSERLLFASMSCFDGVGDVLYSLWSLGVGRKYDWYAFLTISFVSVQYDDTTFFLFANVHDSKIETVGRQPQVIIDADRELTHQRFFAGDACANHRHLDALAVFAILDGASFFKLSTFALGIESQGDSGAIAWRYKDIFRKMNGSTTT